MSAFLVDTNIPSKLTRQKSAPLVERWLDEANVMASASGLLISIIMGVIPHFNYQPTASKNQGRGTKT